MSPDQLPTLPQQAQLPHAWPMRPNQYGELLTPIEAAQYIRLDECGHNPRSAARTLQYFRDRGDLRATKFAKRVWFRRTELDAFLERRTEMPAS